MKRIYYVILIALGFSFLSCNKEEPTYLEPAPTRKAILISKNWKLSSMTVNPAKPIPGSSKGKGNGKDEKKNSQSTTNWFLQLSPCYTDNLKKYNEDGSLIIEESERKCNVNDPQTVQTTWLFNPEQTIITENSPGKRSYKILSLDFKILKVSYEEMTDQKKYTYTLVYNAQ